MKESKFSWVKIALIALAVIVVAGFVINALSWRHRHPYPGAGVGMNAGWTEDGTPMWRGFGAGGPGMMGGPRFGPPMGMGFGGGGPGMMGGPRFGPPMGMGFGGGGPGMMGGPQFGPPMGMGFGGGGPGMMGGPRFIPPMGRGFGGMGIGMFPLSGLDLTEEQLDKLQKHWDERAQARESRFEALAAARDKFDEEARKPNPDAAKLKATKSALLDTIRAGAESRLDGRIEMMAILTPEQRERIPSLADSFKGFGQMRGPGFGGGFGPMMGRGPGFGGPGMMGGGFGPMMGRGPGFGGPGMMGGGFGPMMGRGPGFGGPGMMGGGFGPMMDPTNCPMIGDQATEEAESN